MTLETIAKIGLMVGFLGMTTLVVRRMPQVSSKVLRISKIFSLQNLLPKILMKIKVRVLRVEGKIEEMLRRLREAKKLQALDSRYWEELKSAKNSNKPS